MGGNYVLKEAGDMPVNEPGEDMIRQEEGRYSAAETYFYGRRREYAFAYFADADTEAGKQGDISSAFRRRPQQPLQMEFSRNAHPNGLIKKSKKTITVTINSEFRHENNK